MPDASPPASLDSDASPPAPLDSDAGTHALLDSNALLTAGRAARLAQYAQLVNRMKAGETLPLPDQKLLTYLEEQIALDTASAAGQSSSAHQGKAARSGRSFTSLRAVSDYLTERGYKIGKSTAANHLRAGKLRRAKNGSFALEEVDRYAAAELPRLDGGTPPAGASQPTDPARAEKADLEARRDRAETELAELKLASRRKDLITAPLEAELSARLALFRSDIENFIHSRAAAMIASVNGDQSRAPELIALFQAAAETWLARYAHGHEFTIAADGTVSPPFDALLGMPAEPSPPQPLSQFSADDEDEREDNDEEAAGA